MSVNGKNRIIYFFLVHDVEEGRLVDQDPDGQAEHGTRQELKKSKGLVTA